MITDPSRCKNTLRVGKRKVPEVSQEVKEGIVEEVIFDHSVQDVTHPRGGNDDRCSWQKETQGQKFGVVKKAGVTEQY